MSEGSAPAARRWLGPRVPIPVPGWIPWAMLVVAAVEVPWTIYLTVTQTNFGIAVDVRTAVVGTLSTTWILAIATTLLLARGSEFAAHASVLGLAMWWETGLNALIAEPIGGRGLPPAFTTPPWLAVPTAVAYGWAVWVTLGRRRVDRAETAAIGTIVILGAVGLTVSVLVAGHIPHRVGVFNGSIGWDLLDTSEVLSLVGAAAALRAGRARWALAISTLGLALFVSDAWFNVVLSHGEAFYESVLFLVVGEFPTAGLCVVGIVAATRALAAHDPFVRAPLP